MTEQRQIDRELTLDHGVRSRTELADGTVLEGEIADISVGGARITGSTAGLSVGDDVKITFVFLSDEKVGYRAAVRHLDPAGKFFGIEFTSAPEPIEVHEV